MKAEGGNENFILHPSSLILSSNLVALSGEIAVP